MPAKVQQKNEIKAICMKKYGKSFAISKKSSNFAVAFRLTAKTKQINVYIEPALQGVSQGIVR